MESRPVIAAIVVLGLLTVVTLLVGIATEGWVISETHYPCDRDELHVDGEESSTGGQGRLIATVGLWSYTLCQQCDDQQVSCAGTNVLNINEDNYRAGNEGLLQIAAVGSLIAALVAVVCGLAFAIRPRTRMPGAIAAVMMVSAAGAAVVAIGLGVWANTLFKALPVDTQIKAPWSIVLVGVGTLSALLFTALLTYLSCVRKTREAPGTWNTLHETPMTLPNVVVVHNVQE